MFAQKKLIIGIVSGVVVLAALITTIVVMMQSSPPLEIEAPPVVEPAPEPKPPAPKPTTYPLTGLPLALSSSTSDAEQEAAALVNARPLCVKIENSYDARPQTGFSKADVVYETISEGGITRFNCIFQSNIPEEVGPVRSARNSDVTLVPQYQGVLFFSGANGVVLDQLAAAQVPSVSDGGLGFHRVDFRAAPHNLYLTLPSGYGAAEWGGYPITLTQPATLEFLSSAVEADASSSSSKAASSASGAASSGTAARAASASSSSATANPPATPVSLLSVPFSSGFIAEWQWAAEEAGGRWLRSMDGPTTDAADGSQIAATNVVVLWAPYTPDAAGGTTWEINLNGSGKASIFTQGGRIDGTWETDGSTPPRFRDASGRTIRLTPGNTWFQVLPPDIDVSAV